jgi:hypothetical protein
MSDEVENLFGRTIYAYTRAEALEDGVLVDVSETAREADFIVPAAVTRAVWQRYIEWTSQDTANQTIQHQEGRLWDVLSMLMFTIKISHPETQRIIYQLSVIPRDGKTRSAKCIKLKSLLGGGDNGEPVITIMLLTED